MPSSAGDVISARTVLAVIRSSRPEFRTAHGKVVFAIHSIMMASGHTLLVCGNDAQNCDLHTAQTFQGREASIDGWDSIPSAYAFLYALEDVELPGKPRQQSTVSRTNTSDSQNSDAAPVALLKFLVVGEGEGEREDGENCRLLLDAVSSGAPDRVWSMDIRVADFVTKQETSASQDSNPVPMHNYASLYQNLDRLVSEFTKAILGPLPLGFTPPAQAPPEVGRRESERTERRENVPCPEPNFDPFSRNPFPNPLAEDPTLTPFPPSFAPPFAIGREDLDPFAGRRWGVGEGAGMLLGPNDPRWGIPNRPLGGGGSIGGVVPPGARYDPIGPPGVPGFDPRDFTRGRGRGGFQPNHPDLEQFPLPEGGFRGFGGRGGGSGFDFL